MNRYPAVSAIVLCRNEEKFIGKCLESVIANDYPKEKLEVLVVDGMSEDGTREIVEKYKEKHTFIRLINNLKKLTPFAFNEGIKNSHGDLIMIMSAHATYGADYIKKCVSASQKYDADNVVGIWKILPRGDGFIDKAVVSALSSSFGVGNAKYRTGSTKNKEVEYVDTGAYGCYKRSVFENVGLFNENLSRGQDMEFNLRLKMAGGKTILVPDAVVYYSARSDFNSFCKHNFRNGVWTILPFQYSTSLPVSLRHLVPLAFVSSLIISGILSPFFQIFFLLFLFITGSYGTCNIYFSARTALRKKDIRYFFIMPAIYSSLHITYGLGSLYGLLKVVLSKQFWKNRFFK
jgi:cellulose synthase/poly-beta-1,6-N-acetylglucosamine synthase-like glycosyltransferase